MDGGAQLIIDLESAINRCLETVSDERDIILDVVNLFGHGKDVIEGSRMPEWHQDGWSEIAWAMFRHPNVQYRHLIAPDAA